MQKLIFCIISDILHQRRTTLNLEDDVFAAAQAYASARALKLGQVVSELIRASSAPRQILKKKTTTGCGYLNCPQMLRASKHPKSKTYRTKFPDLYESKHRCALARRQRIDCLVLANA